jgi:mannitol 2-dehydrogenase
VTHRRLVQPAYDPSSVTTGIVHIGPGAFHRAHQAVYADELLARGHAEWGICAVGLLPGDRAVGDALRRQEHRYVVALKHPDGALEGRVVGSVVEHLYAPDDPERVLRRMTDPRVRVVTLTITEGGYDVATAPEGNAFGYLCEALRRRRAAGSPPFAVLSCDNIEANGDIARAAVTGWAARTDPDLAEWVRAEVPFPSCMVDRITPVTTDEDRALVHSTWGVADDVPVVAEPFRQWVVEDSFPAGRPPWEDVGVQVVPDVRPYEQLKLRLLNGGHQALAYVGVLLGHTFVHEAAADPLVRTLLRRYLAEAATTLDPLPGVDVAAYQETLLERFGNPHIRDSLARICAFTSDRIPRFVSPVAEQRLAAGLPSPESAAVVASWARYLRGTDDDGLRYDVVDARSDLPAGAALLDDPVLAPIGADAGFRADVTAMLDHFDAVGVRAALAAR